jgi:hypothetical protein
MPIMQAPYCENEFELSGTEMDEKAPHWLPKVSNCSM